jgi:hypothetical protein
MRAALHALPKNYTEPDRAFLPIEFRYVPSGLIDVYFFQTECLGKYI